MSIQAIFAHVSCADLKVSRPWYEKLFGKPPTREPMPGLLEWQFSDTAEVQLFEDTQHAGHSTLTLRVLPLEPGQRPVQAGLNPSPIHEAKDFFTLRLHDPDQNLIVLASAERE